MAKTPSKIVETRSNKQGLAFHIKNMGYTEFIYKKPADVPPSDGQLQSSTISSGS